MEPGPTVLYVLYVLNVPDQALSGASSMDQPVGTPSCGTQLPGARSTTFAAYYGNHPARLTRDHEQVFGVRARGAFRGATSRPSFQEPTVSRVGVPAVPGGHPRQSADLGRQSDHPLPPMLFSRTGPKLMRGWRGDLAAPIRRAVSVEMS